MGTTTKDFRSIEEANKIATANMGLVHGFCAKKTNWAARLQIDPDEAFSVAMSALFRAAKKWDPAKGTLGTYAFRAMSLAYTRLYKRGKTKKRGGYEIQTFNALRDENGKLVDMPDDQAKSPSWRIEEDERLAPVRQLVEAAMQKLDDRQRMVFTEYHVAGKTLQEIADSIGISKEWARKLNEKSLETMRQAARRLKTPV